MIDDNIPLLPVKWSMGVSYEIVVSMIVLDELRFTNILAPETWLGS
jgi:hypothetical protein